MIEFGSALHVLRDPGHHGAGQWAAGVRARMSPRLAAWTQAWWWTARAIRSAPLVTAGPPDETFSDRLDALRGTPAARLAVQLLRPISLSGDTSAAVHWSRSRGPGVAAVVDTLVARPAQAVADFLEFLEQSWNEWFGEEWSGIRPVLAARARQFGDIARTRGPVAAVAALDASVTPAASGAGVSIAKLQNARHDVSRRGLLVAPSTLISPHLYVADVPGQPLLLIHQVEAGPRVRSPAEMLRTLDAVANRGRLEVARAIATEPRTAGEIAALWKTDPTLVNRHLRTLASAGLARTLRRGRFVQYQLDEDAVRTLGSELLSLLLR